MGSFLSNVAKYFNSLNFLAKRIITSLGLLFLGWIIFFYIQDKLKFEFIIWIILIIAIYELLKMFKFKDIVIIFFIFIISIIARIILNINLDKFFSAFGIVTWCIFLPFLLLFRLPSLKKIYVGLIAFIVFIPAYYAIINIYEIDHLKLVYILSIASVLDICAYFGGKKFGKHKLAIHISPNKTVEGALCGFIGVFIYLTILDHFNFLTFQNTWFKIFNVSLLLSFIGIIGDLFESWLKRIAMVKDSGKILPEHGGVYDRIDSMVAIVTVYYALLFGNI